MTHKPTLQERTFSGLNQSLVDMGRQGEVISILTHGGDGFIHCYGNRIENGYLVAHINLTFGEKGTRVTGMIRYHNKITRKLDVSKGTFVPASVFGLSGSKWIVLTNMSTDHPEAIAFPRLKP